MSQGLKIVLDPEEAPLELVRSADGKSGYAVMSPLKKSTPQSEPQWASNIDTEGELSADSKDKNIEVVPKLRMCGRSEEDFREVQLALEQKLNKMREEGGTLRLYYPDESWIDYEVRAVTGGERLFDNSFISNWRTEDEITFVCAPFGEGQEYLAGEFSGTDRVLECEIDDVRGSTLALARVELTSLGADVWELLWGRDSRNYTGAATALALYQATELTPVGGAKTGTRTIEGKAGTPVVKQVLNPNWSGQLTTDLPGGTHLTHDGVYEVLAWISMPTGNNGEVGIGLDYGVGDLSVRTTLKPIQFPSNHVREGKAVRVSLGQVFLNGRESAWQGQINTRSTNASDELDILAVGFRPLSDGNGRISATATLDQPASLLLRDEFNQPPGALNGRVLAAAQSVTGPNGAGAASTVAATGSSSMGSVNWSNPEGIKGAGGSVASAALPGAYPAGPEPLYGTTWLKATNFGFGLPSTAVVEGLLFEWSVRAFQTVGTQHYASVLASAIKGGVIQGSTNWATIIEGKATKMRAAAANPMPRAFSYLPVGSSSDLFDTAWLYSDINTAGFGIVFGALGYGETIEADHVRCTVYWTDSEGQKWVTSGDATDIAVETGHTAQRSESNDVAATEGRWAIAGTTTTSDVVVGINAKHGVMTGAIQSNQAVTARYVDANNFLLFGFSGIFTNEGSAWLVKRVGGSLSPVASVAIPETTEWHTLRLQVDRRGRWFLWLSYVESGVVRLMEQGQDSDLATGGALAVGKLGFEDAGIGTGSVTRNYDQFVVWIPPLNAIAYEGLGLKVASDRVERQGPNGAWSRITPEGDYLKLAPAGLEGRKNRLVFIASPHDPETMPVGFPTELKAAVYVTPRYRGVPDPA